MASQTRSARLSKFLSLVVSGKRLVTTADSFVLLLESVQDQTDHAACVERIIASPPARNALHAGLRFNTKPDFLNKHMSTFIAYLMEPTVKALCNGQLLIVEPCTVWNALLQAFRSGQLTAPAPQAFAWLLYLYDRWTRGKHHSMPSLKHLGTTARGVWDMDTPDRTAKTQVWTQKLLDEHVSNVQSLMKMWSERTREILRSKRIIGEILESHVLVAMGPRTKQLIMIGDHKQLRPKINNYSLSVEKGSGYDLNRSLFERLVGSGYSHCTLAKQHRMVPEISCLVRNLTYPDLMDGDRTLNGPEVRGLQDGVIFINHTHPEDTFREVSDRYDAGTKGSKRNTFGAQLVLKIVRYIGQQGYGTNKLVVLTPYLGQLHLLREELRKESDPVLNDLDSYDLVRAGLISQASAQHTKRPIRLSTIDNYQGEESDVIIATLTRSNGDGEIGFMSAPQRLNVLLSRARDVLIMIGNSQTFKQSRKGQDIWIPLFDQLKRSSRKAVLREINHFEKLCPDGGCQQACGTKLNCGLHDCPQKYHKVTRPCFQQQNLCSHCDEEDKETERRRKRDMELDAKREAQLKAYIDEVAQIKDEILHERRVQKEQRDEQERQQVLQQHRDDLNQLRTNIGGSPRKLSSTISKPSEPSSPSGRSHYAEALSSAEQDWEYQKEYEGAKSTELDKLMSMIGLKSIKLKFLAIKAQGDAALRQNIDFKEERFGSVLLGNPGTGKTTVARIYAKFLTSMGIIPGSHIEETTGSRLANGGVSGCEKQINAILNKGGGVLFIDEAYQLAPGAMGSQVLDFLLAEIQRLTGKVVVVLFTFEDYSETELRSILEFNIDKKFSGRMKKLQEMIGLGTVKDTLRALLDSKQTNYERELVEEPLVDFTLNRVFLGSPGTGKTTVAKLYGKVLVNIGYLSNGEEPADFVGSVIGQSEQNTKGILASTVGKVLAIDEAYGLFGGGTRDPAGAHTNQYKTAVVDTIVAEVQSVPGDKRCVLLLGYEEQMRRMFQNVNPGLSRRFPMDAAFVFDDFSDDELGQILDLKLRQQGFKASAQARKVALEVLSRGRNSPHFGNVGEIDNLLDGTKLRQQKRRSSAKKTKASWSDLLPQDFDPDYDRGDSSETNIPMLFQGIVGCETIVKQLEGYRQTVKNMRHLDMDPKEQVPFNFFFRGPPGTGKTSTARKMGKVYYDMNLLSSAEVIESSATDLIGSVLLIDEAYRLAEGHFAKEAMDEIVDCITKPKFFQKLIIILAGYDNDINRLMATNRGLTSRFPNRSNKMPARLGGFCMRSLESPRPDFLRDITNRFAILARSANWANARDVQTLGKAIFGTAIQAMQGKDVVITEGLILDKLDDMISERTSRATQSFVVPNYAIDPSKAPAFDWQPEQIIYTPPSTAAPSVKDIAETADPALPVDKTETCPAGIPQDDGVTDEVWSQLQQDLQSSERKESDYQSLLEEECDAQKAVEKISSLPKDDSKLNDDTKKQHEYRRLEELALRAKLEKLQRGREAKEAERRKEQNIQHSLRQMSVCPMGYRWIKQTSGYRCAGGSHYVSNVDLGV
ncbi:AAA domain-containing protein [Aspergillus pseudodeflectus]|uniref:AAA domain-containing protein n=1 Tax=Aspergillus pseudodeflectus TaxID=176178 RepID=A0ABR4KYH2_9EURO